MARRATVADVRRLSAAMPRTTVIDGPPTVYQVSRKSFVSFTTAHFDGHPSVLVRGSRIGELELDELEEIIADVWLSRAPKTVAERWLADRGSG